MNQLDQTIEDLKFCVETLGMNDDEVEEFMNITSEFGVRPEYFLMSSYFSQEEDLVKIVSCMTLTTLILQYSTLCSFNHESKR